MIDWRISPENLHTMVFPNKLTTLFYATFSFSYGIKRNDKEWLLRGSHLLYSSFLAHLFLSSIMMCDEYISDSGDAVSYESMNSLRAYPRPPFYIVKPWKRTLLRPFKKVRFWGWDFKKLLAPGITWKFSKTIKNPYFLTAAVFTYDLFHCFYSFASTFEPHFQSNCVFFKPDFLFCRHLLLFVLLTKKVSSSSSSIASTLPLL